MNNSLLNILVDPITKGPLRLDGEWLYNTDGMVYPINNGIPRFVLTEDSGQKQTETSFGYKWQQESSSGLVGLPLWVSRRGCHAQLLRRPQAHSGCGLWQWL